MLEVSKKRAEAQGSIKSSFSGVRRQGGESILALGDEWTFPMSYDDNVCTNENFNDAEYIYVETKPGVEKPFYVSTFDKSIEIFEPAKTRNGFPKGTGVRKATSGEVIDFVAEFISVDEMMEALKGRRVKISKVETFQTQDYNNPHRVRNAQIYTIDFADKVEDGAGKKAGK